MAVRVAIKRGAVRYGGVVVKYEGIVRQYETWSGRARQTGLGNQQLRVRDPSGSHPGVTACVSSRVSAGECWSECMSISRANSRDQRTKALTSVAVV